MREGRVVAEIALAVALALLLVAVVGAADTAGEADRYADPPDAQSTSGPAAPVEMRVAGLAAEPTITVTIPGVPAYDWHHGCGPTAAGMVIGYWDGQGYDALVPGDADTQTAAVDEMMASEGPASNYTDYCEPRDDWPVPLQPDKSELPIGDEHPDECLADYMKTSQSYHYNYYGWSWFSHVGPAMRDYTSQVLTSTHVARTRNLYTAWDGSLNWDSFRVEIDGGRPMVFLVDTGGDGSTDHFVTAIGYGTTGDQRYYACLNTWDSDVHWFEFAPMAEYQAWGIFGAVTYELEALDHHLYLPVVMGGS
jgi:hypothetical protein